MTIQSAGEFRPIIVLGGRPESRGIWIWSMSWIDSPLISVLRFTGIFYCLPREVR
jgi:hypothetical protein